MFAIFRRQPVDKPGRPAPVTSTPAYEEHMERFLRLRGKRVDIAPEDRALLAQLRANPPAWDNSLRVMHPAARRGLAGWQMPELPRNEKASTMLPIPPAGDMLREQAMGGAIWQG